MIRQPPKSTLFPYTTLFPSASVSMCGYHLLSFFRHANSKNGCERLTIRLARRQFRKIVENCEITRHQDRKSTRLNSSHLVISYAVFCLQQYIISYISYPHLQ